MGSFLRNTVNTICISTLSVATGLYFVNVLTRYFFSEPLAWAEEVAVFLFIMGVLLAQINVEITDNQLNVTIITMKIKNKYIKCAFSALKKVAVIIAYSILIPFGIEAIKLSYTYQTATIILKIPYWFSLLILELMMAGVIIISLVNLVKLIIDLKNTSSSSPQPL